MIKHVLADGREVDSIEGMVIPASGATETAYRIIADFARKHPEAMSLNREKRADASA